MEKPFSAYCDVDTSTVSPVMKRVTVYTDGACKNNPGPGGWGVVLRYNGVDKHLFGGERETTNNRMELTAAIKALEALKEPCVVQLYSDSKYVVDGATRWRAKWKKNNWCVKPGKPIKNPELWTRLDELLNIHSVNFEWVKGHAGHPDNEKADRLAAEGLGSVAR